MTNFEAIRKFFYFSFNYKVELQRWTDIWGRTHNDYLPTFILGAKWKCDKDHIISIWKTAEEEYNNYARMNYFFANIDDENREILVKWMMKNYNG